MRSIIFLSFLIIFNILFSFDECLKKNDERPSSNFDRIESSLRNNRDRFRSNPLDMLKRVNQLKKLNVNINNDKVKNWLKESIKKEKMNENDNDDESSLDDKNNDDESKQSLLTNNIKINLSNIMGKFKKVPFKWG
jgi:hypothetical protein